MSFVRARRWGLGALFCLASGLSGCSCGADSDLGPDGPRLCVGLTSDDPACHPDGSSLDLGTVPVGDSTTSEIFVHNRGQAPLEIADVRITNDTGDGELFSLALCGGNSCEQDDGLGLETTIPSGATRRIEITFDAQVDGEIPAERLVILHDDPTDSVDPTGAYVLDLIGLIDGCRPGYADANGDVGDGCECELIEGATEVCDGLDNDCNGTVDDGVPGAGIVCETGQEGLCADGETACVGGQYQCVPNVGASAEVCDGEDNDCDGAIDEEGTWEPYDDGLSGGNMTEVAFDPRNPGVAYALVGNQTYLSQDGGQSFTKTGEAPQVLRMLAFPPADDATILAVSDAGLWRSEDEGDTWSLVALGGLPLRSIHIHPADPARILIGTTGAGIYVSTNGGVSFDPANVGVPFSRIEAFSGDPANPAVAVATVALLTPQGVLSGQGQLLRTTNAGGSWSVVLDNVGRAFGVTRCESDANLMFAGLWGDGVARSIDGGASWTFASGLASQAAYDVVLSPTDCTRLFASVFPIGAHRSDDGAQSFVGPLDSGMNAYPGQVAMAVDPTDQDRVLAANHSGVFLTENAGSDWVRVEKIQAANVTRLARRPSEASKLYLSTWGQGVWQRDAPSTSWTVTDSVVLPRDYAFTIAPDPGDAQRILIGAAGDMWLSTDGGSSYATVETSVNALDFEYDPSDPHVIFAATQTDGVLRSQNGGTSWSPVNAGLPPPWPSGSCVCQDIRDILVDPVTTSTVYIGAAGQGVFRSDDAGNNWQAVAPQIAGLSTSCLTFDGTTLLACVGGSGIWRSDDSATSFTPVTQGNPELSNVSGLLVDDGTGDLYATSDAGVFRSGDDGANWDDLDNACLPTTVIRSPQIVEEGGQRRLVVATDGAGVLALPLSTR